MIFKDFQPHPALATKVKYYRLRHFLFPAGAEAKMKPYPARPEHCIAFYPKGFAKVDDPIEGHEYTQSKAFLSGQYTYRINKYASTPEFLMILVVFHPGALYQLTGIPASEFQNKGFDLELIFPSETRQLNEHLANTESYSEMLQLINQFLLKQFSRNDTEYDLPVHKLLRLMMNGHTMASVEKLAGEACLSMRQLERVFVNNCGVSPSRMMQIVRFNEAYLMKMKHPEMSWLRIAMECNYHDYQHLSKAFREFAMTSPNQLFETESMAPEHLLGLTKFSA